MKRIATFDLDSTLADTEHRHHMIDRVNGTDWSAYSKACVEDALVEGVARLVHMCRELGVEVHYVTGRMEDARPETIEWLQKHVGEPVGAYEDVSGRLWMDDTESGDHIKEFGSHAAYKVARIKGVIQSAGEDWAGANLVSEEPVEHLFHVDDYASVALGLAAEGIACIAVRPPFEVRREGGELS